MCGFVFVLQSLVRVHCFEFCGALNLLFCETQCWYPSACQMIHSELGCSVHIISYFSHHWKNAWFAGKLETPNSLIHRFIGKHLNPDSWFVITGKHLILVIEWVAHMPSEDNFKFYVKIRWAGAWYVCLVSEQGFLCFNKIQMIRGLLHKNKAQFGSMSLSHRSQCFNTLYLQ